MLHHDAVCALSGLAFAMHVSIVCCPGALMDRAVTCKVASLMGLLFTVWTVMLSAAPVGRRTTLVSLNSVVGSVATYTVLGDARGVLTIELFPFGTAWDAANGTQSAVLPQAYVADPDGPRLVRVFRVASSEVSRLPWRNPPLGSALAYTDTDKETDAVDAGIVYPAAPNTTLGAPPVSSSAPLPTVTRSIDGGLAPGSYVAVTSGVRHVSTAASPDLLPSERGWLAVQSFTFPGDETSNGAAASRSTITATGAAANLWIDQRIITPFVVAASFGEN
jgi:hypothetical protein